jgi:hypothetical protein
MSEEIKIPHGFIIHFGESPVGKAIYKELRELKEKYGVSWTRLLGILLDAYHEQEKLEKTRGEKETPTAIPQQFSVFVKRSNIRFSLRTTTAVQESYWMPKYIGKKLLYVIVVRSVLYKMLARVFEEKLEGDTRKYVLADIKFIGTYIPEKKNIESMKKTIEMKLVDLCYEDYLCRGIEIEPELNRIYHISLISIIDAKKNQQHTDQE